MEGPDIAENGASVPLGATTTLPGVRRLMLLVEKNPGIMTSMFELTEAVEPSVTMRVKMRQSSKVFAVAMMNDGRVLYAQKDVEVSLDGCGGAAATAGVAASGLTPGWALAPSFSGVTFLARSGPRRSAAGTALDAAAACTTGALMSIGLVGASLLRAKAPALTAASPRTRTHGGRRSL